MKIDKSTNFMASTTSAIKNMEMILSGKCSLKFSNACLSLLSLMDLFFAYMEDCHLKFRLLIRLEILIDKEIFLTMDHFVIFCGQIQPMMAKKVSILLQEELDIVGEMTFLINLVIQMTSR